MVEAADEDRRRAIRDARTFFDDLWAGGDPWDLDDSALDQARYRRQVELLVDRRYRRGIELGCAGGSFTRFLAPLCDHLVAVDIADAALDIARAAVPLPQVDFVQADVMELDVGDGPGWDLAVLAETAYYLGWSHSLYDVGWMAHRLTDALTPGARLLLVNTIGEKNTSLMSSWLVRTYRDLFVNVGLVVEHEETMTGVKDAVTFDILLTLLQKRPG